MKYAHSTSWKWLLQMAWRDSRKNKSRLFLFIASIVAGIGAFVAIQSFREQVEQDIQLQAAGLIGADLSIRDDQVFTDDSKRLIDSVKALSSQHAHEVSFASMVHFGKNGGRLVEIRAIEGKYPFYGQFETRPEIAEISFRNHRQALVDKSVMLQFNAEVGDSIQVGILKFKIAGILDRSPGKTGISTTVAPAVIIPFKFLELTGLNQVGSRMEFSHYFLLKKDQDPDQLKERLQERFMGKRIDIETIASRKAETGRSFADLSRFLSLIGFIALLLGCIGVTSTIRVYIAEKIKTIALLRCLGASSRQTVWIFLIQVTGISFFGALIGSIFGVLIQQLLPFVVKDFVPVEIRGTISWQAVGLGIGLGLVLSIGFAFVPLLQIRKISPLLVLRSVTSSLSSKDRLTLSIYGLLLVLVTLSSYLLLQHLQMSIAFVLGICISLGILYLAAKALIFLIRRFFPNSSGYIPRQALANLFRPQNQTVLLVVSIGLGTMIIATMSLMQSLLLDRVKLSTGEEQANMVLFDVQTSQKDGVEALFQENNVPIINQLPIVTVQIDKINGYTAQEISQDSTLGLSGRAIGNEIRATYRSELDPSERVTKGIWIGQMKNASDTAIISLDEGYARRMGVQTGDLLEFNVQGVRVITKIGSLRAVDWDRVQPNFRVVFPKGVIDKAPQFHVYLTRIVDEQKAAAFQRLLFENYPTISVIDLGLVLSVLEDVLSKISFVIQFMGGFSILTGFIVLISSVIITRYQRIREYVTLRTLGASNRQLTKLHLIEYALLGSLSALCGILLALGATWLLAYFAFEIPFRPNLYPVLVLFFVVTGITMLLGMWNFSSIRKRPPLEILRKNNT
jgi:putative ABC transport system permease protein